MIRDTKSVPVRGLKIVTASEKCGGSVLKTERKTERGTKHI